MLGSCHISQPKLHNSCLGRCACPKVNVNDETHGSVESFLYITPKASIWLRLAYSLHT